MGDDLLLQHLKQYLERNYPPDCISVEWPNGEDPVIRFEWFSGKQKDFGYTSQRREIVFEKYNEYWRAHPK
jgi:hypothetical protein